MAVTLTAEDGSGKADANAYVDVTFVDTYHENRGRGSWAAAASADVKKAAIIRATDFIDAEFGHRFRGYRRTKVQALEWPRNGALDDDYYALSAEDDVPRQLQRAVAELALRALLQGEVMPDPPSPVPHHDLSDGSATAQAAQKGYGRLKRVSQAVEGAVEQSKEFDTDAVVSDLRPYYPLAERMLSEILTSAVSVNLQRS